MRFSRNSRIIPAIKRWAFTVFCGAYGVVVLLAAVVMAPLMSSGLAYVGGAVLIGAALTAVVRRNPDYAMVGACWLVVQVLLATIMQTVSLDNAALVGWLYVAVSVMMGLIALILCHDYRYHRHLGII